MCSLKSINYYEFLKDNLHKTELHRHSFFNKIFLLNGYTQINVLWTFSLCDDIKKRALTKIFIHDFHTRFTTQLDSSSRRLNGILLDSSWFIFIIQIYFTKLLLKYGNVVLKVNHNWNNFINWRQIVWKLRKTKYQIKTCSILKWIWIKIESAFLIFCVSLNLLWLLC